MRLRVEFTTEPFDLDEAPAHAVVAREVIQSATLDAVDVGPFGNTVEGDADAVLTAVDALLRKSLEAGATRVSLQVNVIGEHAGQDPAAAGALPDGGGR
ncbi:thiamine-binding protein [Streptomyces sp. NPDC046203]|uniref:thiamine-binding protein n=1 Tax=Streptomyces sp. NPDC046203 TaxID=3154602 RepID=UPI0033C668D8